MNQRIMDVSSSLSGISLRNNKDATSNQRDRSIKTFVEEGLYQAQKVKGGYKLARVKLDSSKGKELQNIFNQLDENGRKSSERPKSENDEIRRYEALQKSFH